MQKLSDLGLQGRWRIGWFVAGDRISHGLYQSFLEARQLALGVLWNLGAGVFGIDLDGAKLLSQFYSLMGILRLTLPVTWVLRLRGV